MLLPLLSLCLIISVAEQAPSYLITAPSIIHVGAAESVSIQLHGSDKPVSFQVYCHDIIRAKNCSEVTSFTLNSDNGYRDVKTITVSQKAVRDLRLWRRRQKYVYLVAESWPLLRRRRMVPIKLSSKRGYIFIQTDKPVYTPNQNVMYRIFALDRYMRPVNDELKLALYDARNMELAMFGWTSKTVKRHSFKIPDNAEPGIWRIVAQFLDAPMSKVTAQFEVKEFVLPRFDVKLQANEMFYLVTRDTFSFKITARHTFGEPVAGVVHVRFGIIHGADNTSHVWDLGQKLKMFNGVASSYLSTKVLLEKAGLSTRDDLVGLNLYMAATVVESDSDQIEDVELNSIQFVSSPYVVDLSKTARHFIPKSGFQVVVTVTFPDGTPAVNVPVKVGEGPAVNTDQQGLAVIETQAPANASILNMKVTAGEGEPGSEFREGSVTAQIYQSPSKSYLHISAPHAVLKAGEILDIEFQAVTQEDSGRIDYIYYIVTSKGKVLTVNRIRKEDPTKLQLQVDLDMVPTFRLLAYYYVDSQGKMEIVANSVWIDVEDKCQGRVEIKNQEEVYKPGNKFDLHFSTNDAADVSFVAVDSAMYILNNKNRLTPRKVFEAMNSYDLGCFYGGGIKSVEVFMDAGLSFLSDAAVSSFRQEYSCMNKVRRQRRAVKIQRQYLGILNNYADHTLRKCCLDGLNKIFMAYSCEQRAQRVKEMSCRWAFMRCCDHKTLLRITQPRIQQMARSQLDDDIIDINEQIFDETSIHVRSVFPQSWLWQTFTAVSEGDHKITSYIPDSITTWEIQTIGVFENKGFCIEEPKKLKVFRPFFLSMTLPYSVRRNEQIVLKVTLYNYLSQSVNVRIYMKEAEGLCGPTTSWENPRSLFVRARSAGSTDFTVVPLVVGNIPINVVAFSETKSYSDAILKHLRVVYEGIVKIKESNVAIKPKEKRNIQILESRPSNVVPDTESFLYITPSGTVQGSAVVNSLSADGIDKLIKVPTGCAEQTAMHMAPTVFAVEYLDQSDQWLFLDAERKDEALLHIQTGYNRILGFKKDDGSYGIWKDHPSSTWLTAFIVKIFSIVRRHIDVNQRIVYESVSYLIKGQKSDGSFEDPHPVLARVMQGGVSGAEEDTTLTAFITVALQHFLQAFLQDNVAAASEVRRSIVKAVRFLHRHLEDIEQPYNVAITAYALAFAEANSDNVQEAENKLKAIAIYDQDRNVRYWQADNSPAHNSEGNPEAPLAAALTVETTAYALLQALSRGNVDYAKSIVMWLTEQQNYGGGFQSTQDTVIALEALSKYHVALFEREEDVNLQLRFNDLGKSSKTEIKLRQSNALTQEELKFPLGNRISVDVSGHGTGMLNLRKVYHVMEESPDSCEKLHLSVSVKNNVKYTNSDLGQDSRHRRSLRDPFDSAEHRTVYYEVCTWRDRQGANDVSASGMATVDITLLSGLQPDTAHLDQLKNGVEHYIQYYEYKEGRLLLYLESVTERKDCIVFPAKQIVALGLMQPAVATLYDFYDPSTKCTVSYKAPEQNTVVMKLCNGEVCTCAEGLCPQSRNILDVNWKQRPRRDFACYSPIVDYAYLAQIVNKTSLGYFDNYFMSITDVFKVHDNDSVRKHDVRAFLNRKSCLLQLKEGTVYLLMGKIGSNSDASGRMQYLLSETTWIEAKLSDATCSLRNYREPCQHLTSFLDDLYMQGCTM